MMIEATIDGVTFSTDPTSRYGLEAIEGWFSSAPVKSSPDDRTGADGAFEMAQFYRGARPITLSGLYTASPDEVQTFQEWSQIASLLADGLPKTLTVTDPEGTRTAEVMLFGSGAVIEPLANIHARYVITLLAFDPIKYGAVSSPSTGLPTAGGGLEYNLFSGGSGGALYYGALGNLGRVTLTNAGTADVWPSFVVTGTLTDGFFIQCLDTGQVLRYERVVPAGTTVSIDSRTGEVLVDGSSDASTYLRRDEFFSVPAGGSIEVQFNAISTSSGSPMMTATVRSGWR